MDNSKYDPVFTSIIPFLKQNLYSYSVRSLKSNEDELANKLGNGPHFVSKQLGSERIWGKDYVGYVGIKGLTILSTSTKSSTNTTFRF